MSDVFGQKPKPSDLIPRKTDPLPKKLDNPFVSGGVNQSKPDALKRDNKDTIIQSVKQQVEQTATAEQTTTAAATT